jgi:heptaprenyl diphosphate synthase
MTGNSDKNQKLREVEAAEPLDEITEITAEKKAVNFEDESANPDSNTAENPVDNPTDETREDSTANSTANLAVNQAPTVNRAGKRRVGGANLKLRRSVTLAALVAAAMVLSYVESLLPAFVAVPGVKLGLANTVTLFALYALDARAAASVSALRVALSAVLFGNTVAFIYSASGALLSFVCMALLKKTDRFSTVGVSVAGGVAHNAGQVGAAALVLENAGVLSYIAPLLISGTVAGVAIGVLAGLLVSRIEKTVNKILRL